MLFGAYNSYGLPAWASVCCMTTDSVFRIAIMPYITKKRCYDRSINGTNRLHYVECDSQNRRFTAATVFDYT